MPCFTGVYNGSHLDASVQKGRLGVGYNTVLGTDNFSQHQLFGPGNGLHRKLSVPEHLLHKSTPVYGPIGDIGVQDAMTYKQVGVPDRPSDGRQASRWLGTRIIGTSACGSDALATTQPPQLTGLPSSGTLCHARSVGRIGLEAAQVIQGGELNDGLSLFAGNGLFEHNIMKGNAEDALLKGSCGAYGSVNVLLPQENTWSEKEAAPLAEVGDEDYQD